MYNLSQILVFIILLITGICVVVSSAKDIYDLSRFRNHKSKPYFRLKFMEFVISIELQALALCTIIFLMYMIYKGGINLNDFVINILVNIGCSISTTIILSVVIYFKFLKHIPDETKKQIDDLLNARLKYETNNHNAAIQKTDFLQNFLSREHSEIKQSIYETGKDITSLNIKFDNENTKKQLQYNYLKKEDKNIVDSIQHLSVLGEELQKVNYENKQLKLENQELLKTISDLQAELNQTQAPTNSFTQSM